MNKKIELSKYENRLGLKHQLIRLIWGIVWPMATWFLPRSVGNGWKRFLLCAFGAKIHPTAHVYTGACIYFPPNLEMEEHSCLAPGVDCYNVAPIKICANSVVSQNAFLCSASHDITDPKRPLITAPIVIKEGAWVCASAFVGMGVTVGEGAVVGARACVFKDVEPWTVVGGNPAKFIKLRTLKNE